MCLEVHPIHYCARSKQCEAYEIVLFDYIRMYQCISLCFCFPTIGDTQDGGGGGLFENIPFMSGLGSSAPQTLPSSSGTESSLLGGGLFSGLGMGTVPTGSAGMCT